jgi:stress response protein YsnF
MTTTEHPMVVGVFRDHSQAAQAIDELHSAGFRDEKIRMKQMATASGLLDSSTSNLIGHEAESQTLPEELMNKGMSQDEAHYYQQEFEAGHSVVLVEAHEHQQEARAILQHHGAYDASWAGVSLRAAGATPRDEQDRREALSLQPLSGHNPTGSHHTPHKQTEDSRTIPVREEVLQAHKQLVQIGEVVLRKEVITEEKTITVPVSREELVIERLPASSQPAGQPAQKGGTPALDETLKEKGGKLALDESLKEGGTLRIVLREEQVRVEKYPVVREEILVSKRQIEETKHISDTVKREKVHIEQVGKAHIQEGKGNPVSD